MGGFFGKGKDKDKQDEKPVVPVNRPSRRAVVAAGSPGTQRVAAPGDKPPVQRATGPVVRPVPAPSTGESTGSVFAKAKGAPLPPPPTSDSDNLVLQPNAPVVRPDTKGPITSSAAPQFSGSLTSNSRTTGPARSGDAALVEFMITKARLISADQAELVQAKAQREGLPLDVAAVSLNLITEDQLVNALTQECWVPHLKVDKYEIRKKALDTISKEDAVHFGVFPVDKLGSLLTLAMVNPLDADTIRVLEGKTNLDIKRVVATRSEIHQGIEKYYSGKVEAKDTSISFTADSAMETKSVTQMLGNVKSADIVVPAPEPEIQDIDDLLTEDEVIAPAIIAPVVIEPPLVVPVGEVIELAEPEIIDSPALEARPAPLPAIAVPESDGFTPIPAPFQLDDAPMAVTPPPVKAQPVTQRVTAAEFDLDDTDALAPAIKPATETRPKISKPVQVTPPAVRQLPAAAQPAAPAPTPVAVPRSSSISRPVTGATRPASGTHARPSSGVIARPATGATRPPSGTHARPSSGAIARPPGSSSNLFPARTSTGRVANPKVVNLIPVLEEEFQHAITHGKAHVFEKWVGLQSRNRIINAITVEAEFDSLLADVFDGK